VSSGYGSWGAALPVQARQLRSVDLTDTPAGRQWATPSSALDPGPLRIDVVGWDRRLGLVVIVAWPARVGSTHPRALRPGAGGATHDGSCSFLRPTVPAPTVLGPELLAPPPAAPPENRVAELRVSGAGLGDLGDESSRISCLAAGGSTFRDRRRTRADGAVDATTRLSRRP